MASPGLRQVLLVVLVPAQEGADLEELNFGMFHRKVINDKHRSRLDKAPRPGTAILRIRRTTLYLKSIGRSFLAR